MKLMVLQLLLLNGRIMLLLLLCCLLLLLGVEDGSEGFSGFDLRSQVVILLLLLGDVGIGDGRLLCCV